MRLKGLMIKELNNIILYKFNERFAIYIIFTPFDSYLFYNYDTALIKFYDLVEDLK